MGRTRRAFGSIVTLLLVLGTLGVRPSDAHAGRLSVDAVRAWLRQGVRWGRRSRRSQPPAPLDEIVWAHVKTLPDYAPAQARDLLADAVRDPGRWEVIRPHGDAIVELSDAPNAPRGRLLFHLKRRDAGELPIDETGLREAFFIDQGPSLFGLARIDAFSVVQSEIRTEGPAIVTRQFVRAFAGAVELRDTQRVNRYPGDDTKPVRSFFHHGKSTGQPSKRDEAEAEHLLHLGLMAQSRSSADAPQR